MPSARTAQEMEVGAFQKSRSRDEYIGYIAKLLKHIRGKQNAYSMSARSMHECEWLLILFVYICGDRNKE